MQVRGTNTSSGYSGVILSALYMPRNAEVYNADGSYGGTAPSDQAYINQYGKNEEDMKREVGSLYEMVGADYNSRHNSVLTSSTLREINEPIK